MTTPPSNWHNATNRTKDCRHLTPAVPSIPEGGFTADEWAALTPSERTVFRCTNFLPILSTIGAETCRYLLAVEADRTAYGDDAGPATYTFIRWFMSLSEADRQEAEACVHVAYGLV